jgi:hypothetical protein
VKRAMMTFVAAFVAAGMAAAEAARGRVSFQHNTPYSSEEQAVIERAVRHLCPSLLAELRSQVAETKTAVERHRIDQYYMEYFFTSYFSFATQEGPKISGTLVLKSDRTSTSELSGFELTVDPNWLCTGKS